MIILKPALSVLAVTSTATALSITCPLRSSSSSHYASSTTCLHLQDPRISSESSSDSDLDGILSKREELKRQSMAEATNSGPQVGSDIDKMSTDELKAFLLGNNDGGGIDDDSLDFEAMLAGEMPKWKTSRASSAPSISKDDKIQSSTSSSGEDEEIFTFTDYDDGSYDENSFHIPNRIGFTIVDWADPKKGFVNGKLKKADRKMGKYNKSDLKVGADNCVLVPFLCIVLLVVNAL